MPETRSLGVTAMLWGCGYAGALLVLQLLMVILAAGMDAVGAANVLAAAFGVLLIGLAIAPLFQGDRKDLGEEAA